jgi:transposase
MDALAAVAAAAAPAAPPAAPSRARLTEEQRWSIIALHKQKYSLRRCARVLGVNKDTARAVWARYLATNSPGSGARSGRPRCTDSDTEHAIELTARIDKFTSPRQIKRKLDVDVSPRTIDRRLQEVGLFGRVARHKRVYALAEIRQRLSFGNGYKNWTKEQWSVVLFSDEKCFYGKGFCGRTWVRREVGTALDPENCVHKKGHPVKVNAWGCFSAAGPGYLHIFYDNMDGTLYKKILDEHLVDVAHRDFPSVPPAIAQWHFLQDNARYHKGHITREWFHNKGVSVLDFPPYSPDLNPIENLWAIVAREVEKVQCDSVEALGDAVLKVWDELPKEVFSKLACSMPERCQAVVDAGGHHTKY